MLCTSPLAARRRRPIWPWFVCLAIAFSVAWYIYTKQTVIVEAIRGPLPTPTATEISAAEYLTKGDSLFLEGEFDEAIAAYKRATELDPHAAYAAGAYPGYDKADEAEP